ncbi:hypothetical protein DAEQUDRAFT_231325 [Daedalea quercina L-15889]|uniref:Uncharacterized protein n=1 Tax=Daedalea quercina L-15889 TaxID=1314783 RepID=A0A165QTS2_9APHY|nr:hypothetical protein DAEQUDRAFT_231325 [Daedalea quercina L-15889]
MTQLIRKSVATQARRRSMPHCAIDRVLRQNNWEGRRIVRDNVSSCFVPLDDPAQGAWKWARSSAGKEQLLSFMSCGRERSQVICLRKWRYCVQDLRRRSKAVRSCPSADVIDVGQDPLSEATGEGKHNPPIDHVYGCPVLLRWLPECGVCGLILCTEGGH